MDSTQIEQYLGFLGQKLADMQTSATLILLGGALMVTQIGNRKTTQDIDVVIATNDRRTYQVVVNMYIPPLQLSSRSGYTTQAIDRCFPK